MPDANSGLYAHMDALAQGKPIPWDDISDEDAAALDNMLGEQTAKYIDQGDNVRMNIFLNERKKYAERIYS